MENVQLTYHPEHVASEQWLDPALEDDRSSFHQEELIVFNKDTRTWPEAVLVKNEYLSTHADIVPRLGELFLSQALAILWLYDLENVTEAFSIQLPH